MTKAKPFIGQHCEAVATGTLLGAVGIHLSEPMIFGLGEGLGFLFLNLASLPLPFTGGRTKPFSLTESLCRNLDVHLDAQQTSSKTRAWDHLEECLRRHQPVGLQLDCFYLSYFKHAPHFAGHFVAAIAVEDHVVEVVDTVQQGTVHRVDRSHLELARHSRGPMASKARAYTILASGERKLEAPVIAAIQHCAKRYLDPAFGGMGAPGILKLSRSLPTWLTKAKSPPEDLKLASDLMERAGTGGALFRNLYRDFLGEAADLVPSKAKAMQAARERIAQSATLWTTIAALLEECARDGRVAHLTEASNLCRHIAEHEVAAMQLLASI